MTSMVGHLSNSELEARYETAADPVAKSHFHALWLLSCGYEAEEVAEILSFALGSSAAQALQRERCRGARRPTRPQRNQADHPDARGAGGSQGEDQGATGRWRALVGAQDCALACEVPRGAIRPRPARMGCPDRDRLFDPAAAAAPS